MWPPHTTEYLQQRIMNLGESFAKAAANAGDAAINVAALWEANKPIEMFELCEGLMEDCPGGLEFANVASLMAELERVRDEHPNLKEDEEQVGYSQEAGADFCKELPRCNRNTIFTGGTDDVNLPALSPRRS
jgi:hypothetical protein